MILEQIGQDTLYLISCALHNRTPDEKKVFKMDLERLYGFTKWHTVDSITYIALSATPDLPQNEVLRRWRESYFKAIRKSALMDTQRRKLFSYMDENNIWYMPLKGIVLRELYPKQSMRQMADNDILFDAAFKEDIKNYFISQGYDVITDVNKNHDVYEKAPIYNYEMHTSLFGATPDNAWKQYFGDVKTRLIKNETGAGYHFTDEDFYVYFIAHAFHHYEESGTGIRSFADCYVYRSVKELDDAYIEKELQKLGIADFEKLLRSVSDKIFEDIAVEDALASLSTEEYELLCESISSGTYGTDKNEITKKLRKVQGGKKPIAVRTKLLYYVRRVFPNMEFYQEYYPFVFRWKILIPFVVIYRVFRGIILHGKQLWKETVMVWRIGEE